MRFVIPLLALGMSACAQDVLNTKPEVRGLESALAMQTVIEPESGTDITLRPTGKVTIEITSNPTTGYYWTVLDGDPEIVKFVSETYIADPAPEGLTGSGGHQAIVFEGIAPGQTNVKLSYQRSEMDVFETRTMKFKVIE